MNQPDAPFLKSASPSSTSNEDLPLVAIIGAGVAGLEAARILSEAGVSAEIFEKARGPGGRLATRRMSNAEGAEAHFDFGAQFFSVFSKEFASRLSPLKVSGEIIEWFQKNGGPRYALPAGMNALAKKWAHGRKLHLQSRVEILKRSAQGIVLGIEQGPDKVQRDYGPYRAVVLTAPLPQALELLNHSAEALLGEDATRPEPWAELAAIQYHPCIAVMLLMPESELGALGRKVHDRGFADFEGTDEPWSWIASNSKKGLGCPPGWTSLTVHFGPQSSAKNLERTASAEFQAELLELFASRGLISSSAGAVGIQVHRWRYSLPQTLHASPFFQTKIKLNGDGGDANLLLAGDGFQKPRVEGAFLSGQAAASALLASISLL